MRRLVLSSLKAHRGRLALTLVAITLSVSFVTASFVLADSLRSVFADVSTQIYSEVDAEIRRGEGDFDRIASGERFERSSIDFVADIDGVDQVVPSLGAEFTLFTIDSEGEAMRPQGPPVLAFSIAGEPANPQALSDASPFTLVDGAVPGSTEIMLDSAQASALDVEIGDIVNVATPSGSESFTLSGTVLFGDSESGVSPYFLLFELPTIQRLLDAPGLIDGAAVLLEEGVVKEQTLRTIAAQVPDSLYVANQADLVDAQNADFGELIDIIQMALLVFAGITTFVAVFVIANTFAVLVGQQLRQLGLLRAIGATTRQAGMVIVAEATAVGAIASAAGLGLGLLAAQGIKALFEAVTTGGFPEGPLELAPRTVVLALIVGVGVTVVSAVIPARKAARTSPMQALQESAGTASTGRSPLATLLAVFALPVAKLFGTSGRLAAMNVKRNPRRVLSTAMSMIVGLALISGMSVMAASYRSTLADAMTSDFDADLIVTGVDGVAIPFAALSEIAALPEVAAASGFGETEARFGEEIVDIASFQSSTANEVLDLGIAAGSALLPSPQHGLVSTDFAEQNVLMVGDIVTLEFSDGYAFETTVAGVFGDDSIVSSSVLVDESVVAAHARNVDASLGAIRFASGISESSAVAAVESVLVSYPQIADQTVDEFLVARQALVDQMLMLANGLLGLTVIIAMSGIANTVALSVLERTNEIGLLRSVGMSRRQLRSMVRYEALITAVVGAVLGTALGVGVAFAAASFVPAAFISTIVVPAGQVVAYLVLAIALGTAAALIPALRASQLNVVTSARTS